MAKSNVETQKERPTYQRLYGWKGISRWDEQEHDLYSLAWRAESETLFMAAEDTIYKMERKNTKHHKEVKKFLIPGSQTHRTDTSFLAVRMAVWNQLLAVRCVDDTCPSPLTLSTLDDGGVRHILSLPEPIRKISVPWQDKMTAASASASSMWIHGVESRGDDIREVFTEMLPSGRIAQRFCLPLNYGDNGDECAVGTRWIVAGKRYCSHSPLQLWSLDGGQFIQELKMGAYFQMDMISCCGDLCCLTAQADLDKTKILIFDTKELLRARSPTTGKTKHQGQISGGAIPFLLDQDIAIDFMAIRTLLLTPNAVYFQSEVHPIGGALYSLPISL